MTVSFWRMPEEYESSSSMVSPKPKRSTNPPADGTGTPSTAGPAEAADPAEPTDPVDPAEVEAGKVGSVGTR